MTANDVGILFQTNPTSALADSINSVADARPAYPRRTEPAPAVQRRGAHGDLGALPSSERHLGGLRAVHPAVSVRSRRHRAGTASFAGRPPDRVRAQPQAPCRHGVIGARQQRVPLTVRADDQRAQAQDGIVGWRALLRDSGRQRRRRQQRQQDGRRRRQQHRQQRQRRRRGCGGGASNSSGDDAAVAATTATAAVIRRTAVTTAAAVLAAGHGGEGQGAEALGPIARTPGRRSMPSPSRRRVGDKPAR